MRQQKSIDAEEAKKSLDVNKELKEFFVGTSASYDDHYNAQQDNSSRYVAGMAVLERSGVDIAQSARVRALAAAWARRDKNISNTLLKDRDKYGLVEILKALTLLDSGRRMRVYEKKIKRLEISKNRNPPAKVKSSTMGRIKSDINNLKFIKPKVGSASGAVCKHIRRWVKELSKDDLEFYALHFPTEPWRKLADICHFNPEKDFPNLPWFLKYCFGSEAPEGTLVHRCKNVTPDNVNELLREFSIPYSHIKEHKDILTEESKMRIATYTPKLDTLIWYYEDLMCPAVDAVILKRLEKGEQVTLNYGKLMERLLTFKIMNEKKEVKLSFPTVVHPDSDVPKIPFINTLIPLAEEKLKGISLPLEAPVVVIGDASPSMNVAIRTSTIIASFLTAITSAKLVFFDSINRDAPFIPTTIEQALEMAMTIKTQGSTAPAASLYPFYERKEVVKTFIVVTDEEENTSFKGDFFTSLFKKYQTEVYPAKLVFVSFLHTQHAEGNMVSKLAREGISVLQFKLDSTKPDLTKLDNLIGLISSESTDFEQQVSKMEVEIKNQGMQKVFEQMILA